MHDVARLGVSRHRRLDEGDKGANERQVGMHAAGIELMDALEQGQLEGADFLFACPEPR